MTNIVYVTGASGSIGRALTFRLLKEGYNVRAIVRNENTAADLRNAGAEIVIADLRKPATIVGTLSSGSIVFHTAAKLLGNNASEFWETNVLGTSLLIEEALRVNVLRFVHISSIAVYGYPDERMVAEDHIWMPNKDLYITTKQAAERVVWGRAMDLPIVVIRPGEVIGPSQLIWTTRILFLIKMGLLHAPINSGCLNPVYIDNLIDALILLGFNKSAIGHAFNVIDGYSLDTSQYIKRLARIANCVVLDLPPALLYLAALILERCIPMRESDPLIATSSVNYLLYKTTFSSEKIRNTVGWMPSVDLETAIINIGKWYKDFKDR